MKILVIGLGSMGKRRIRLIKKKFPKFTLFGVDSNPTRCLEIQQNFKIFTSSNLHEAFLKNLDAAFICTPPNTHADIIYECLFHKLHVFTEINLVSDRYDELERLARQLNKVLFISSTFLYRDEIKEIKKFILTSKNSFIYNYQIGQYLPDWHPWESYLDFFVVNPKTNACREILAIELPWIISTFGKVIKIHSIKVKISTLDVNYPDSYIISLLHENNHIGSLTINLLSKIPIREIRILNEDLNIFWSGTPDSLKILQDRKATSHFSFKGNIYDQNANYNKLIIENAYENEISHFIDQIKDSSISSPYSFTDDFYILGLIDEIER
jgi:predicted dehydrogenase